MQAWERIVPGGSTTQSASEAKRFFVDPYNRDRIYIVDTDAIKKSEDGGTSWRVDQSLDAL